jgi:hypothetical protein
MSKHESETVGIRQRSEVTLHVPNDLKALARLFVALAAESPRIEAWRFYSGHQRAAILVVTADESAILRCVRDDGFECEINPVVVMPDHQCMVSVIRLSAELRANGVHLLDAYTCSCPRNGTALVLKTTDGSQAADLLGVLNLLPSVDPFRDVNLGDDADREPVTDPTKEKAA